MSIMATPIVLSQTFVNGEWLSYHPQTTASAVETNTNQRFVTDAQIAAFAAAEQNSKAYTDSVIATELATLVGSAPETLDTLGEIAAALQESDGAHAAILQAIGEKAAKTYVDAQLALKADAAATTTRFEAIEAANVTTKADVVALQGAVALKADAAATTKRLEDLETEVAGKLESADVPTTSMGETAPEGATEGSIFLKVVTPGV